MSLPPFPPESGAPRPGSLDPARTLVFRGHQLLVDAAGMPVAGPAPWRDRLAPLRTIDFPVPTGETWAVVELAREIEAPARHAFQHLKSLLDSLAEDTLALAARALELVEFDRAHRFCGACGAPTALRTDPPARRCSAPDCGREHFPRVSPVVIVAVERGPEILLGRSPHFPSGLYSTLAGFVDAGESAEQAVHREIFEETGVRIRSPRYFSSQAWPFPHALMLGYQAEYEAGEIVCAPGEIEDARFFHVDALPPLFPIRYAMANLLLRDFCLRHDRPWPPRSAS
jgi:NAD+ diphosphatase